MVLCHWSTLLVNCIKVIYANGPDAIGWIHAGGGEPQSHGVVDLCSVVATNACCWPCSTCTGVAIATSLKLAFCIATCLSAEHDDPQSSKFCSGWRFVVVLQPQLLAAQLCTVVRTRVSGAHTLSTAFTAPDLWLEPQLHISSLQKREAWFFSHVLCHTQTFCVASLIYHLSARQDKHCFHHAAPWWWCANSIYHSCVPNSIIQLCRIHCQSHSFEWWWFC